MAGRLDAGASKFKRLLPNVGACASEILGVGQSSKVTAISEKHYLHQSNFYFRHHQFIIFIQGKSKSTYM